ncbi:MAG: UDP-galactopyranose mutase [Lachnospiraceae bacterium]|jgi:UDP-galactopyranose mutase|nr:UDP-galactopyranose mutase [Lachnospiraceae bacterium]MCX4315536.1 UDP-galactopyranose mutase [Lachnospiraceae bacterium]
MYDAIIVGAGFAGAVTARRLAEAGLRVLILEQREHIGGNAYDEIDEAGILVQLYGPHIYHTKEEEVHRFLSRFTSWHDYRHEVVANIHGRLLPVPFNLNTLELVYGKQEAAVREKKLTEAFGYGTKVPILKLREHADPDIREIADYVYENIFLRYTMKQWGQTPEEIDPAVTGRVPIVLSRDNRYFTDTWQGMPEQGFTALFEAMLAHENITIRLGCRAQEVLEFVEGGSIRVKWETQEEDYSGIVVYTGPVDELFDYRFGHLPYRTLKFAWERCNQVEYQTHAVVNYTVDEEYTRITEFKKFYDGAEAFPQTTIIKEYPGAYEPGQGQIPYYAIINEENNRQYEHYLELAGQYPKLFLLGRLAEYKYYNMDAITKRALELSAELIRKETEK